MLLNTTPRVGLNVNPVDHMTQHCPCKTAHVTRLVPPTHLLLGVLRPPDNVSASHHEGRQLLAGQPHRVREDPRVPASHCECTAFEGACRVCAVGCCWHQPGYVRRPARQTQSLRSPVSLSLHASAGLWAVEEGAVGSSSRTTSLTLHRITGHARVCTGANTCHGVIRHAGPCAQRTACTDDLRPQLALLSSFDTKPQ